MEVQSVINESALKEARKYLIKPGIRKISAIASAAFVLLAAYCMLTGRPSTMLLAVFAIVIFYGELKMIESKQIKGFLKKLKELYGKTEVIAPIVFRDADILIQNPLSGGKNAVRYEAEDSGHPGTWCNWILRRICNCTLCVYKTHFFKEIIESEAEAA